jgi:protein-tyrosine phosphatase
MMDSFAPALEGVHNFRPLRPYPLRGGGQIRAGMIYRSGALERMTAADQAWLSERAGVRTILDLRHPDEVQFAGSHGLADRVMALSLFPEDQPQEALIAELNGLYGAGPSAQRYLHYLVVGGDRLGRAFTCFANEAAYPVLVHCTAGKDRTGVLFGLLMDVLGAAPDDITAEYSLSNASLPQLLAYLAAIGRRLEGTPEEIHQRLATPPERMAGFLALLHEQHGGAEPYFLGQGVSAATISAVRRILTVAPTAPCAHLQPRGG